MSAPTFRAAGLLKACFYFAIPELTGSERPQAAGCGISNWFK